MKAGLQRVLHRPCGKTKVFALGLCATCYTLKRQDEEYFGGLRERFWNETATAAESVMHQVVISGRSSCITAS